MSTSSKLNPETVVAALREALGENLRSVCLYGSAVRGDTIKGVSDLNLLIVLNVSDAAAHEAIARVLGSDPCIEPFILGATGFERSVRAFAAKFASIKRWHRVLHGEDVLAGVTIPESLERFLCEQALRNLRLRTAHAFVTRSRHKHYGAFLTRNVTAMFLRFSEIVRLNGGEIPNEIPARVPVLEKELGLEAGTLRELLALKAGTQPWRETAAAEWHTKVFTALDTAVRWIENHWPQEP
jgi:hypothetical protein